MDGDRPTRQHTSVNRIEAFGGNASVQFVATGCIECAVAERSALLPFDRLGRYAMRRFDGTYDAGGSPVFQVGDVLIETPA